MPANSCWAWSRAWTARIAGPSPSTAAHATPDGLQHLLARANWDADAVRDDLRDYVIDAFGDPGAILVVDLYRPRQLCRGEGWDVLKGQGAGGLW